MGKGKKGKGDHKQSSGNRKLQRVARTARRLGYKINRWKRYQEEIKAGTRQGKVARWDTAGLEKHKALLESML